MTNWRQTCRGVEGIRIEGDGTVVMVTGGRHHRINVRDSGEVFELTGIVVRPVSLESIPDAALRAWTRNRATQLVGFRVDQRGRLVGEAWIPKAGLSRNEFLIYLRRVAAECDLFEYHLTGKDRE